MSFGVAGDGFRVGCLCDHAFGEAGLRPFLPVHALLAESLTERDEFTRDQDVLRFRLDDHLLGGGLQDGLRRHAGGDVVGAAAGCEGEPQDQDLSRLHRTIPVPRETWTHVATEGCGYG